MTAFITQMRINPARQGARRLLASPHRMHAAVSAAFPNLTTDERLLWRVDSGYGHDVRLMLVSPRQPDLTHVVEQAGWPTLPDEPWLTKDYEPFLHRLDRGQVWAFRLRANPVVRKRDETGRIQTFAHVTAAQQQQWLLKKADVLGVEFIEDIGGHPSAQVHQRDTQSFERRAAPVGAGRRVTVVSALFEGAIRIKDADAVRHALTHGVGRAKAYGCGLITLARRP